ncbi:MAG: serine/threonine protein kinase [Candidatus Melainabacteria bacterium]|nr:serine/threonine protein kinase [Candidatus Melainabacteria bacterium]
MIEDSGRITIDNTCSECGQHFSPATKICPNDGTRLVAVKPKTERLENTINKMVPADSNQLALSAGSLMAQALSQDPPLRVKEKKPKKETECSDEVVFESEEFQTKKCDLESSDGSMPATFARETAAKLIGQIVNGQYQIVSAIGYGGMSVVFRAKDLKLGKFVALKMLLPHLMMQSHSMARFQQEAQSASALNHPHVVSIHNYGETESGQPFLVMDLIEGSSLSTLIKKDGQLPVDRALNIFIQLASALSHAHQKGIVHRDLKPSNVLLTEQNGETDFCKIVDFGIAKLLPHEGRDAVSLTQTGDVFGSPLYMSPEQCKGERLDGKADIYSMGCLMYESLSGTPPHCGNNMLEVLYRHMNEVPKDFKSLKRGIIVPQRLEATIFKALAKEPAARHQSMQALHDELKQILLFRKTSLFGRLATSWELFVLKRRPRKRSEFIILGALAASLLALSIACAYLVSQYVFADESPVFKQALDWRTTPLPPPANVGETAISLYQNDIDNASSILKDSPEKINAEILEHVTLWGSKMGDANRWQESQKAYSLALELSRHWNGELCLPTLTLRRQYAEACYYAKDYAFAAREFALYQQHVKDFLYGEKVPSTLKGIVQTAEAYYYLHQYSDAITAYRNFFASMHGAGLEWTHWGAREIGNYVEEAKKFQSTEGYALVLSHLGDCLKSAEVWQRARENYKDAAARWHILKSYENEALANLKIAAIEEKLNEDPAESYEAALKALKPDGSLQATCIVEKQYADYLWRHGNAIQAILLKLDYSRQVPKVKL